MDDREWGTLHYNASLGIEAFHACCRTRAYPPHMHDYYVVCLIDKGRMAFSHRGARYLTPAGGLILLNPGDDHTGGPVDAAGFEYRCFYPTGEHMREATASLAGRQAAGLGFASVRADDRRLAEGVRRLHASLMASGEPLESEAIFVQALTGLVSLAAGGAAPAPPGRERDAVRRARQYIHAHWQRKITLGELAACAGLSRYYFLKVFCSETGMPPHAYLDSVRMGYARRLLRQGLSQSEVACEAGFSDQSHFANRFKRLVGVTPGCYAKEHLH